MRFKFLVLSILFVFSLTVLPGGAYSQAEKTRRCSEEAEANINQVIQYMRNNLLTFKQDYEFDAKLPRKDDRVRDRMERKINDIKVRCDGCQGNLGLSVGPISDRIRICYEKAKREGLNFCDFVGLVTHEYGHMIGMPRDLGHNRGDLYDETRMFGWFAKDLCQQDRIDRNLTDTPLAVHPAAPTSGIVLFPHVNFEGRGRNFTGEFRDLRDIGRNDSVSSLRVISGVWEAYEDKDFEGWCHVFSRNQSDLRSIRFNDEISSLRPATSRRSGITVFRDMNSGGGSRHFTAAIADLRQVGINDQISSIQMRSGRWEVCSDPNFRDCRTFDASQSDLRRFNLNDRISSLRPQ